MILRSCEWATIAKMMDEHLVEKLNNLRSKGWKILIQNFLNHRLDLQPIFSTLFLGAAIGIGLLLPRWLNALNIGQTSGVKSAEMTSRCTMVRVRSWNWSNTWL